MVRAAALSANAHNTQLWLFRVLPDRIDVFADPSRTIGTIDPLLREQQISLGCALENRVVAATAGGLLATPTLVPDPSDPTLLASVQLEPSPASVSPLHAAIPRRHTDRAAYRTAAPLPDDLMRRYRHEVEDDGLTLHWLVEPDARDAFGALTVRATEAIIADPQQAADDYAWYRAEWRDIQRLRDGVTIDASGQPAFIRSIAKILPTTMAQNHDGWLGGTRDIQVATAAAFGAIVVPDGSDPAARLRAGRAYQRLHLMATLDGVAMQPLCQIPERIDREESAGLDPHFARELADLLLGDGQAIMTFRAGYPTQTAPPSPRRALEDVVLSDAS